MTLELTEEERQIVLLALARLSIERPGWDFALNEIAKRIDQVHPRFQRGVTYEAFRLQARLGRQP